MGEAAVFDLFVNLRDVGGAELRRVDGACDSDECFGDVFDLVAAREGEESGTEYLSQIRTRAFGFGWASSFCSASNCRAARWLLKALRLRVPCLSRQSA